MHEIKYHKRVIKFINSRVSKEKKQIKEKLDLLKINPYPNNKVLNLLKMKNKEGFRLRINDYRFIYQLIDNTIYIKYADNRGDIY